MEPYFEYHYVADEKLLEGIRELSKHHHILLPAIPDPVNGRITLPLLKTEVQTIYKELNVRPIERGNNINDEIDERIAFTPDKIALNQEKATQFGFINSRSGYPTFRGILDELDVIKNSPLVTIDRLLKKTVGYQSISGVHIPLIKIGHKQSRTLLVVGGAHPDEYISVAIALELCYSILRYSRSSDTSSQSQEVKEFLKDGSIHIIPVLNPDGYRYNIRKNRKWRKNLKKVNLSYCKANHLGVNLNRNYPIHFGWDEENSFPNTHEYQGPFPLSENETRSLSLHLRKNKSIRGLIDFHAREGMVIFRPRFGYRDNRIPHASRTVGASSSTKLTHFENEFISGALAQQMAVFKSDGQGPNTGALDDYSFFAHELLTMTVECGTECCPKISLPSTKRLIQGAINGVISSLKTL